MAWRRDTSGGGVLPVSETNALALSIQGLSKSFDKPGGGESQVLHGLDLDVETHEFLSVIGPSGCGKTTLLRILCGLEPFGEGCVNWEGEPRVAMVFQDALLLPWRTVLENTTFSLECIGGKKEDLRDRAVALLEGVGLGDYLNHHPHEISTGMQQRVGLARALLVKPDILLMDEPYSALDIDTRSQLQDQLLSLWEQQDFTVIFVSHSLDEVAYLSDRVAFLSGTPARIEAVVPVELPRPRSREAKARVALVHQAEMLASFFRGGPSGD